MTDYAAIEGAIAKYGLSVVGGFHPLPEHGAPEGVETLLLLGPGGPQMWSQFHASPEVQDGADNGMDRWSYRVITDLADKFGARAAFPFGGPPWSPFQKWAAAGEFAVPSPMGMQASPSRGLWASYRGALMFPIKIDLPDWPSASPCAPCLKPCQTACPVDAFASGTYDVPRCVAHVTSEAGLACRDGCLIRKACPAGQQIALPAAQRAFHMAAFLKTHTA